MRRAHGQIRRGQVITTYGPGSLLDLPDTSAIVAGLDSWPKEKDLQEIVEPRMTLKLQLMTGVASPRIYAPPPEPQGPQEPNPGIDVYRFPEWFVVQEKVGGEHRERSRRLVRRSMLDRNRFEGRPVVPTRFVRACPRGHIADIDWKAFAHGGRSACPQQLWLDERGTSGDLRDLVVSCECGAKRSMSEAANQENQALGPCNGDRPWLGRNEREECGVPARLLVRTASNAYFPQVFSVLSLPDRGSEVDKVVGKLWDDLSAIDNEAELAVFKKKPKLASALASFSDEEVIAAIERKRDGSGGDGRPVKEVELEAILAAEVGHSDDVPIDPDFHARRLPRANWAKSERAESIKNVVQLHRLREVLALTGFTRFEAQSADIHGEFDPDVRRAQIAREPSWFPAVENRGEGVFLEFDPAAVQAWRQRPSVIKRLASLAVGHERWNEDRKSKREFPDGPYILLHTLSHLLLQSLAMRCGYPATSIRERIYAEDGESGGYGILLYTGTPDAEGTLGGLVQEARHIEQHLATALRMASLCSNDPICSNHSPGESMEDRLLHGAACHGCVLVAETSCEMRNDYLDRALVVPVLGVEDAAFFEAAQ